MEEGTTAAGSEPRTYTLKHPITVGGEQHRTFTLRRPKARSFRRWKAKQGRDGGTEIDFGAMMEVLADSAGVSSLVVDELDAEDLFELVEVLTGFLPGSPQT